MDAGTLHVEISKVCPVAGVSVGVADDRATWSFTAAEGATQPQIDAGNNVIATIPVDQKTANPSPPAAALYDHEARIAALEGQPALDLQAYLKKMKLEG